jgi:hypothetical protein
MQAYRSADEPKARMGREVRNVGRTGRLSMSEILKRVGRRFLRWALVGFLITFPLDAIHVLVRSSTSVNNTLEQVVVFLWPSSLMLLATFQKSFVESLPIYAISIAVNSVLYGVLGLFVEPTFLAIRSGLTAKVKPLG